MAPKRKLKRRNAAATKAARERALELQRIENLLGEDFESLAQARKALKSETSDVVPKAAREVIKLGEKRSYTIRELKDGDRRAINAWLNDRANAEDIQKVVLKRGEVWGAESSHQYLGTDGKTHKGVARTWQSYGNLDQLFKRLSEYVTFGKFQSQQSQDSFVNSIKVIRFGRAAKVSEKTETAKNENRSAWFEAKKTEVKARIKRKDALARKLAKADRSDARIRALIEENKKLKRRIKEG